MSTRGENLLLALLGQRRLIMTLVLLLALIGLLAWLNMDRQEDPFFPYRYGDVLVPYPGADPEQVERLILNPLEESLAQVADIREIRGTARLGFAHVLIAMQEHVYDTDAVWDRIRVAVDEAAREFPAGAGPATVDDRQMDAHGIVLAVSGSDDLLELREAARRLKRDLFQLKDIARIDLLGDPGESIIISWDEAVARQTGLDAASLGQQLAARNQTLPGGNLRVSGRSVVLDPASEFRSLAELAATPIRTRDGAFIPLGELASVRHAPDEPVAERIGLNGRPAVGLGIILPDNRLNVVAFGNTLRAFIDERRADYAPLEIEELFFQPHWVERRLSELGFSLLLGIIVVAAILFATMGLRLGLTVSLLVPLVTFSALAVYAMGGGVLHQMAVAGMVIALGMLVDNAIVMSENIQWHRDQGLDARESITRAVRELATPLMAATGTTLAAFTPLLLSAGDTADFTRAIPVMVMLTLGISFIYALLVTPVFAGAILRPRPARREDLSLRYGQQLGRFAVRRPWAVLGIAAVLVFTASAFFDALDKTFFPNTDRDQLVVDLHFPEGTHLEHTDHAAAALAAAIQEQPGVKAVYRFAGFSGPRFYYNLIELSSQPHLARLVVQADSVDRLAELIPWVRATAREQVPEAQVVARRLGQGPPVDAPVEIRVFGEDPAGLSEAAEQVLAVVRDDPGSRDARHTLGQGLSSLFVEMDDARAAEYGLDRGDLARALTSASRGLEVSTWRVERDAMPLRIRSPEGENFPLSGLAGLGLGPDGIPLAEVARIETRWQPAVIQHWDLQRMTQVLSQVADEETYASVLRRIEPKLAALELPPGTRYTIGGAAEGASDANTELFRTLPIGGLLLIIFLLLQFNSFRMMGMVLITVPLAVVGVIPGLWLAGQPFGFTAMLGVVALVGIVVNNAIVLLDRINLNRSQGQSLDEAITEAVGRRTRPILLTTATTVAGLFPLTLTQSTLWPPLAWAIISGLLASTLLTLAVVPALYRLAFRDTAAA
ncbi:efflux RND transporter permease subunit [Natronospira bacteriovora]|uniref:Efflux RND transporter permease subunit n=1 Tax=Natronospira bacteriovora TaxID=3069753 RepID=A0ABU0W8G6_9GAMM|nr:efflux RND transporter permease subunit [Natronospira sp. AB-CW4]MDQ2070327.1 efflux RND transporter permease subunit [Natronospira sp. AB-CW4]